MDETQARQAAERLWKQVETNAQYSFNRSHAVAYAQIAWQCAYIKCHYPIAWYTALLNERRDEQTKLKETITAVRKHAIPFLGANIYKSRDVYVAEGEGIRVGLTGLQDFGQVAYNELRRAIDTHGRFETMLDFVRAVSMAKLNSKAITALIRAGALDDLGDRGRLITELPLAVKQKQLEAHERYKALMASRGLTLQGAPYKRAKK